MWSKKVEFASISYDFPYRILLRECYGYGIYLISKKQNLNLIFFKEKKKISIYHQPDNTQWP
jgi:hypothetical protein